MIDSNELELLLKEIKDVVQELVTNSGLDINYVILGSHNLSGMIEVREIITNAQSEKCQNMLETSLEAVKQGSDITNSYNH